jgi:hypothetical protein
MSRVVIVVALVLVSAAVAWAAGRWQTRGGVPGAVVPQGLVPAGESSWLVLTTPWCASCGPVIERLQAAGELPVVVVDLAERPDISRALDVRQAPTVLRVGADGAVLERRAGAGAALPVPA